MKYIRIILIALLLSNSFVLRAEVVDINQANATALSTHLKGIGPKKAKAIVAYRKKHGPFKNYNDLLNVKGIGEKTLSANRKNMVIGRKKQ